MSFYFSREKNLVRSFLNKATFIKGNEEVYQKAILESVLEDVDNVESFKFQFTLLHGLCHLLDRKLGNLLICLGKPNLFLVEKEITKTRCEKLIRFQNRLCVRIKHFGGDNSFISNPYVYRRYECKLHVKASNFYMPQG